MSVRISERVPVEVTEGVGVFVCIRDEVILGLLDSDAEADEVFDTDEEALTVIVLYIVIDFTGVRDIVEALVDVLLCELDRVSVVELEDVLDRIGDNVTDGERNDVNDGRADTLREEDTELLADSVIKELTVGLAVLV